jgi:hypothetical protein
MKNSLNFLQIANWIYILRCSLKSLRVRFDKENVSKDEALKILKSQKKRLELIKDIMSKTTSLQGIQPDFLKNLKNIKKEYGLEG